MPRCDLGVLNKPEGGGIHFCNIFCLVSNQLTYFLSQKQSLKFQNFFVLILFEVFITIRKYCRVGSVGLSKMLSDHFQLPVCGLHVNNRFKRFVQIYLRFNTTSQEF